MAVETQLTIAELTGEFQLNGFESGAQFGSTVHALSGGGFAVVHGNQLNTTATLAVSIYSADGIPVETATGTYVLPYSGAASGVQMLGDPVIAENADGSILLRWNSDDDTFGSGSDLFTASINPADGSITRTQSLVQNITEIGNFALTVADNGYQHTLYQSSVFENLQLNVKDADGSHVSIYGIGSAFDDYDKVDIVTLSNGNVLIAATEEGTSSTNPIHVQVRSATGLAVSPLVELDPVGPSDTDTDIKLAALSNGGFAIAYASEVDGTDGITLYVFSDLEGLETPTAIRVDANLAAVESAVDITALNNGWVAVSWTEANAEGGTDIRGRVFDSTGTPLTDAVLISSGETDADDSSIAALNNGSIVVSWTDALADSEGDSIQGKILTANLEITGDDLDNTLIGGVLGDNIQGRGGNDSINGFDGNDTLNGEAGDDTVDGNTGDDSVIGGAGNDSLYGWFGNDTLEGGLDDDRLFGEEGNDSLLGGAGSDHLFGGNGDDYINPGDNSGVDYILPGSGNDTVDFSGLTSPDTYVEIDNFGLSTGVTVTIDGDTNTGSIDKGPNGTTTLIDINRAMVPELSGAGIYGSDHDDVFNIDPVTDGFLLVMGMAGNDVFNILNGDGFIRLGSSWWNATTGMVIDLSTGIVSNDGYGSEDTINGVENLREIRTTMFNDSVTGSAGDDQVILMAGNDTADGGDGFDTLRYDRPEVEAVNVNLQTGTATGTWRDEIFTHTINNFEDVRGSREGDDIITGNNAVHEQIDGRGGDDTIKGGGGDDTLMGGDGQDSLRGNTGDDSLHGDDGGDFLWGDAGQDTIWGGAGADQIGGGNDNDTLSGGAGDDTIWGGNGDDLIDGTDGNDSLWGVAGNDTLTGGIGSDTLYGGDGFDTLDGGDGRDLIWGGLEDDVITGKGNNDTLWGQEGNDSISGGGGADRIGGGNGNDSLLGGADNDTIWGGNGEDQIGAGTGDDIVYGGNGNDQIQGWTGNDILKGAAGHDTLIGDDGNDELTGGNGNDHLEAGSGNDTIYAGSGVDVLLGDEGQDDLWGGIGADTLDGGTGNDTLRGGADTNADVFVFSTGADIAFEFGAGDMVDLSSVSDLITDFADLQATHLSGAIDAIIDDGAGNTLTLIGVGAATLDESDFIF